MSMRRNYGFRPSLSRMPTTSTTYRQRSPFRGRIPKIKDFNMRSSAQKNTSASPTTLTAAQTNSLISKTPGGPQKTNPDTVYIVGMTENGIKVVVTDHMGNSKISFFTDSSAMSTKIRRDGDAWKPIVDLTKSAPEEKDGITKTVVTPSSGGSSTGGVTNISTGSSGNRFNFLG